MKLQTYLDRIAYAGPLEAKLETLRAVHRAHLFAVPYENLDIHLGRRLTLEVQDAYRKIVLNRRGGWCFEMNGLLAWALERIGFRVTCLSASVNRAVLGEAAEGNHLVLRVEVGSQAFMADVGFGDGLLEPIPLESGTHVQDGFTFSLEMDGPRWVFRKHEGGGPGGFDFGLRAHRLEDFAERCAWLQTSSESGFVRTTVCQKATPAGFLTLRGARLTTSGPRGESSRLLESAPEFERALRDHFGLEIPGVERLWEKVWARHLEWLASNPVT